MAIIIRIFFREETFYVIEARSLLSLERSQIERSREKNMNSRKNKFAMLFQVQPYYFFSMIFTTFMTIRSVITVFLRMRLDEDRFSFRRFITIIATESREYLFLVQRHNFCSGHVTINFFIQKREKRRTRLLLADHVAFDDGIVGCRRSRYF